MGFILLYFKMHRASPLPSLLLLPEGHQGLGIMAPESSRAPSPLLRELQVFPVCVTKSKTPQQHHTQARSPCELRTGREPAITYHSPRERALGWKAAGWVCGLAWVPSLRACASCLTASCITAGLATGHFEPSLSLFSRSKLGLIGLFSGSQVSR